MAEQKGSKIEEAKLDEYFKNANQAESYAKARPTYPASLFDKLASLTEHHELAWDVGTGNGQAAVKKIVEVVHKPANVLVSPCIDDGQIAEHFKSVVATDVSETQLSHATKAPNVKYAKLSAKPSVTEVEQAVGPAGSVDLITVATALHWFDLDNFYPIVKQMLRKPGGVFAAWTYANHYVTAEVDKVQSDWHEKLVAYRPPEVDYVFNGYKTLPFPFEPVKGDGGRGVEVETLELTAEMNFDGYIHLWESSSAVNKAQESGFDLLTEEAKKTMLTAWGPREKVLTVTFPFYLLVGTCSHAPPTN